MAINEQGKDANESAENTSIEPAPKRRKSRARKVLGYIKEWGGVATLVIALLYTFPLGVFQLIESTNAKTAAAEDAAISSVRQSVSDMSQLIADKISHQIQSQDPRYRDALNVAYDIRIYNTIYSKKELFKKWAPRLRSSEIYAIGSSLTLIGEVGDSQQYYTMAFAKAVEENNFGAQVTAIRERGYSLFMETPYQDKDRARKDYLQVLDMLLSKKQTWALLQYTVRLSELSTFELSVGDWACGDSLRADVEPLFQKLGLIDPGLANYYTMFQQNVALYKPKQGQPMAGCSYKVPLPNI